MRNLKYSHLANRSNLATPVGICGCVEYCRSLCPITFRLTNSSQQMCCKDEWRATVDAQCIKALNNMRAVRSLFNTVSVHHPTQNNIGEITPPIVQVDEVESSVRPNVWCPGFWLEEESVESTRCPSPSCQTQSISHRFASCPPKNLCEDSKWHWVRFPMTPVLSAPTWGRVAVHTAYRQRKSPRSSRHCLTENLRQ